MAHLYSSQKIKLQSLPFLVGSFLAVTDQVVNNIKAKKSKIILPCSLNDFASITHDPTLIDSYQRVDICTTDGMPLVWLSRWKIKSKLEKIERVYGPDLMMEICQKLEKSSTKHVFYGSSERTLRLLQEKIKNISPQLNILEFISPPMRKLTLREERIYIKRFQQKQPDVIWIGLSSPTQIELAARWKKYLPHTTFMCVGAAFDFVAGVKPSAPTWMKRKGLEWIFRLTHEPKRLWRRYLITIPKFLLLHGVDLLFNP